MDHMEQGDQDNKVKAEAQPIGIVLRDQQGSEVHFKIKTTTKFEKVFKAFSEKKSLELKTLKFVVDGLILKPNQTPAEVDMEDGDVVDVMMEQIGGCM